MKKNTIIEIICLLFIILFVYAAGSKMMDYENFRIELGKSPILTTFADWIAWMVPSIEIAIAVMLSVPRWRLTALYASFSLMAAFSAYIVAILNFSDYIPCSCGGILQNMSWKQHLVFNIGFMLLALLAILIDPSPSRPEPDAVFT